ncbi:MAG: LPXTG cell wall anchor domain-containing protein [Clostridiales bacterium]|nr:LPXTG cell wall anchor domain-containing protein [Clostridiales bacterium]
MDICRRWLLTALLLFAVLSVGLALPGSLAYMMAQSNTLRNTFCADYIPPYSVSVPVSVHKSVISTGEETVSPAGFSFLLRKAGSQEAVFMTTDENGYASVLLPFYQEDAGRHYSYELSEVNSGREHITYSDAVYTVDIALSMDRQGQLTAALSMNGQRVSQIMAEFENIYDAFKVPDTGDSSPILLWLGLALISGTGLILVCKMNKRSVRNAK